MIIDKIAYIRIENKKILITRSKGRTKYYIPGGKREMGETDSETLVREIKEELDIQILEKTIKYFGTFEAQADNKPVGTMVKMTCYTADYEGIIRPENEIEEVDWFNYSDIDKVTHVDIIIFNYLKEQGLLY